jgi:hypothetical protein
MLHPDAPKFAAPRCDLRYLSRTAADAVQYGRIERFVYKASASSSAVDTGLFQHVHGSFHASPANEQAGKWKRG